WPVRDLVIWVNSWTNGPWNIEALPAPVWWSIEIVAEIGFGVLLTRYGNLAYWALDRFFLEPALIRPTEWLLEKTTTGYARLLAWSLRHWGVVLVQGAALIAVALVFFYFDILGRELVPSEDQSRFVVHVVCPVGSSIDQVDELLQECEAQLAKRDDSAGILTTVATEPGQLMNEADIFVQLVPQYLRPRKQQFIMREIRRDLEKIHDIRVVIRDQSTEGF